ncbi:putative uncharacterized protein DDB_G0290521 [Notolabrus celidotus]|uniref:putative uncharacterized protein DDB_G0290521 n=1 Tax=Notolabrus celidotus TaxID=1203425 RepID=UPI0014903415|nr:putative uncharacterized protein DDB_G0290521 [Notolabrus celidotus]
MGLFVVSRLLLMTLLLQSTIEDGELKTNTTLEPDGTERYGEFCLRISDDSHWTSSKPVTQLPSKSSSQEPRTSKQPTWPNRESTRRPNRDATPSYSQSPNKESTSWPTRDATPLYDQSPNMESTPWPTTDATPSHGQSAPSPSQQTPANLSPTQHPEPTTQNDWSKSVPHGTRDPVMSPNGMIAPEQCVCKEMDNNRRHEVSQFNEVLIQNPTKTCSVREFFGIMTNNNSTVCLPRQTVIAFINYRLTEQSGSTNSEELSDTPSSLDKPICINCPDDGHLIISNSKLLECVRIMCLDPACPHLVLVTIRGEEHCIDSAQPGFKTLLEKLGL